MISNEAVIAAQDALPYQAAEYVDEDYMRAALEAAAPHMLAACWDAAMTRASEVAWEHDASASSAVSQIPNPYRRTDAV